MWHLPDNARLYRQVFRGGFARGGGGSELASTMVWHKPRGCRMVSFWACAGGGGGSGGWTRNGTNGGGGGGGASSGIARLLFSSDQVPDCLIISPGLGGLGAAAGQQGAGNAFYNRTKIIWSSTPFYDARDTSGIHLLLCVEGAQGGGQATTTGGATGGLAGGQPTATLWTDSAISKFLTVGQAGQTGGFGGAGGDIGAVGPPANTGAVLSGGAGGGGCQTTPTATNGGRVYANFGYPLIAGGAGTTSAADGGRGDNGYDMGGFRPEGIPMEGSLTIAHGGGGGGASSTQNGGAGGFGAVGCGGGGGGCGTNPSVGGRGGDGGEGCVIITAW